jgi:tetratricopeptide (TPR) repeat protein
MQFADYQSQCEQVARLVDQGKPEQALPLLDRLLAGDLPDLDKAVLWINKATVHDKLKQSDQACECHDKAVELERTHNRFFAAETKAAYLTGLGRRKEAVFIYNWLLDRRDLTLQDRERVRQNLRALESS